MKTSPRRELSSSGQKKVRAEDLTKKGTFEQWSEESEG